MRKNNIQLARQLIGMLKEFLNQGKNDSQVAEAVLQH